MPFIKSLTGFSIALALLIASNGTLTAQESEPSMAGPEDMPAEIAEMFADMQDVGADVDIAPSGEPQDIEGIASAGATAGSRYIYTTLRVITSGSNRGCGYANWNCMTNLCKSDLRDTSAWRGWAGCWKRDSWICYFECGQRRNAF